MTFGPQHPPTPDLFLTLPSIYSQTLTIHGLPAVFPPNSLCPHMSQSQPEKQTPVRKQMSLESVSSLSLLLLPLSLFPSLFLPLLSSLSFLSLSTLPVPKPCFPPPPEIRAMPSFLLQRVSINTEPIAVEVLRLSNDGVFGPKLGHLCYQLQGSEDLEENGAEKM